MNISEIRTSRRRFLAGGGLLAWYGTSLAAAACGRLPPGVAKVPTPLSVDTRQVTTREETARIAWERSRVFPLKMASLMKVSNRSQEVNFPLLSHETTLPEEIQAVSLGFNEDENATTLFMKCSEEVTLGTPFLRSPTPYPGFMILDGGNTIIPSQHAIQDFGEIPTESYSPLRFDFPIIHTSIYFPITEKELVLREFILVLNAGYIKKKGTNDKPEQILPMRFIATGQTVNVPDGQSQIT